MDQNQITGMADLELSPKYKLGNEVHEMKELDEFDTNGAVISKDGNVVSSEYQDVDNENSSPFLSNMKEERVLNNSQLFGNYTSPNDKANNRSRAIRMANTTSPHEFVGHPQQRTDLQNRINPRITEESQQRNNHSNGTYRVKSGKKLKKDVLKNMIKPEEMQGYVGDKTVEEICAFLNVDESKSGKNGKSEKSKRPGKTKTKNQRKNKNELTQAEAEAEEQEFEVEVALDTDDQQQRLSPITLENPFRDIATPENLTKDERAQIWLTPVENAPKDAVTVRPNQLNLVENLQKHWDAVLADVCDCLVLYENLRRNQQQSTD